jgi:hypothetical protein
MQFSMSRCQWAEVCVFFTDEVGYSPELQQKMREEYCLGDNTSCARLLAMEFLPADRIDDDLLPTDLARLALLRSASTTSGGGAD